jgi:ACS family tartrate transporter-like MFS transporter
MVALYFLHNCAAYGCMTFLTSGLKKQGFTSFQYGFIFSGPYLVAAVIMILNSWHSDKTHERRGHVAAVYILSGTTLILSVLLREHFWLSYVMLCLAIPGPFAAMGPFWALAGETLPKSAFGAVAGVVNAFGNLGGFAGPYLVGWLSYHARTASGAPQGTTAVAFALLGAGMLVCAILAFLLPRAGQLKHT